MVRRRRPDAGSLIQAAPRNEIDGHGGHVVRGDRGGRSGNGGSYDHHDSDGHGDLGDHRRFTARTVALTVTQLKASPGGRAAQPGRSSAN